VRKELSLRGGAAREKPRLCRAGSMGRQV